MELFVRPEELKAVEAVIRAGIAPTVFAVAKLDKDPHRDCRLIAASALASLFNAGFTIVRRDA
ncbi:hypothetical protein U1839_21720 [Sphingomonas sp. RT2P30]|uniref:hypothetical protein n=1 Tax=Parasphingomonas halimpatiens TaxID=3096162 RepID=UPI002FCA808E